MSHMLGHTAATDAKIFAWWDGTGRAIAETFQQARVIAAAGQRAEIRAHPLARQRTGNKYRHTIMLADTVAAGAERLDVYFALHDQSYSMTRRRMVRREMKRRLSRHEDELDHHQNGESDEHQAGGKCQTTLHHRALRRNEARHRSDEEEDDFGVEQISQKRIAADNASAQRFLRRADGADSNILVERVSQRPETKPTEIRRPDHGDGLKRPVQPPQRRPPPSVALMTSNVSGPGERITASATTTKAL